MSIIGMWCAQARAWGVCVCLGQREGKAEERGRPRGVTRTVERASDLLRKLARPGMCVLLLACPPFFHLLFAAELSSDSTGCKRG